MRRRKFVKIAAATIAWPAAARAQRQVLPVVGVLGFGSPGSSVPNVAAFHQGLNENGYVEGQNLAIKYRWAEGNYERLPDLAADLVAQKVDVIVAGGGANGALAAKNATSTIPIVFVFGGDPVASGLVTSLARPGGNVTGVNILVSDLNPKRLELLSEAVPQARSIALLVNPKNSNIESQMLIIGEGARRKGWRLNILKASSEKEIDAAFAFLVELPADALMVSSDPFFSRQSEQLVTLASRHAVPAIYEWREFVALGGLMSYGPNLMAAQFQAGIFVSKILKGRKPADLPVEQPTRFELVINLKTAKVLDLTVPPSLLARADEVIE